MTRETVKVRPLLKFKQMRRRRGKKHGPTLSRRASKSGVFYSATGGLHRLPASVRRTIFPPRSLCFILGQKLQILRFQRLLELVRGVYFAAASSKNAFDFVQLDRQKDPPRSNYTHITIRLNDSFYSKDYLFVTINILAKTEYMNVKTHFCYLQ